jgi:ribulose-5-phosphate 4-epimerase/fuculose-1-phosphate aldolase
MESINNLIKYSRALYDRRLVLASRGNTSIRVDDLIWTTQTGAVLGELTEADLTRVTQERKVLDGGKPSKELGMHLSMYQARPNENAIIHVHPTFDGDLGAGRYIGGGRRSLATTMAAYLEEARI